MANMIGKKIFFLYPPSVIQKEMIYLLMAAEHEVALLYDAEHTLRVLAKYPDSILYVNIDSGMQEPEWDAYVRRIMADTEKKDVRIGVVSYNSSKELAEKYLLDIGAPCGFVTLKIGLKESFKIIITALEASEARGRRKYVRAVCRPQDKATFNVKLQGNFLTGNIIDISSVGMACTFDQAVAIRIGTTMSDIQLKLRASLCKASGKLVGFHSENDNRHIVLFQDIASRDKQKIQQFIYNKLQEEIDAI